MKRKFLTMMLGSAALLTTSHAVADDTKAVDVYLQSSTLDFSVNSGAGVSDFEYEHSVTVIGLSRQAGEHFALDFRFGVGDGDTLHHPLAGELHEELDRLLGFYGRVSWNFAGYVEPYGLVGITDIERTTTNGVRVVTSRDQGYGFGAGIRIHLGDSFTLQLESMQLIDDNEVEASAASFGVGYRF